MKDHHINIFECAKVAWLEAARAEGKPIPIPRYRPAVNKAS